MYKSNEPSIIERHAAAAHGGAASPADISDTLERAERAHAPYYPPPGTGTTHHVTQWSKGRTRSSPLSPDHRSAWGAARHRLIEAKLWPTPRSNAGISPRGQKLTH